MICSLLSALLFAIQSLCVKMTGGRVPALEVALYRSSLSFLFSIIIAKAQGIKPMFGHRENHKYLILRGICGAMAMNFSLFSILMLPIATAVTIGQINPPITALVAYLVLKEALGWPGALGCLASLTGVVVVTHPPFVFGGSSDHEESQMLGSLFGVVAALFSAGAFLAIRKVGTSEPALVVALFFHIGATTLSSLPLMIGWPDRAVSPSLMDNVYLVIVAVTSFLAQLLMTRGFQLTSAAIASAILFSQVMYSYIFGMCIFGDPLTLHGVLGGLMVAVGIFLVARPQKQVTCPIEAEEIKSRVASMFGCDIVSASNSRVNSTMSIIRADSCPPCKGGTFSHELAVIEEVETYETLTNSCTLDMVTVEVKVSRNSTRSSSSSPDEDQENQ